MNRKEATELLPIIQAYAEGKEIEIFDKTMKMWKTAMLPHFDCGSKFYRIKPEAKYRPFVNVEECWQELLKHEPFGWVKDTEANEYLNVYCISNSASSIDLFGRMFKRCIFIDGSPYGIKVEK